MKVEKVCEECGRINSKVRFVNEFEMVLCESCYKTYKYNPVKYIPPIGEIHYDMEGKVICHICGRSYNKLTCHIKSKHNISSEQYKEKFGLNRGQSLVGKNLKEVYKNNKNTDKIHLYRTTFKKGHTSSKKPRRLQCIKNRTGTKYKNREKDKREMENNLEEKFLNLVTDYKVGVNDNGSLEIKLELKDNQTDEEVEVIKDYIYELMKNIKQGE